MDKFNHEMENMEAQFMENVNHFYVETKARLEKKNKKKKPKAPKK